MSELLINKDNTSECEFQHAHKELVDKISEIMPGEEELFNLAELYKIFGDSTRIKILYALFEAELCVCDIAMLIGMSVSAVSHQLRILKQARLVQYRREGKTLFYSLSDDHVRSIIGQGMEHIEE
ncbi:MAG: ArsR/SmtB family transcription factor [Ruminiclostridium sp.]